jgi:hypothetical protein
VEYLERERPEIELAAPLPDEKEPISQQQKDRIDEQ